MDKAWKIAVLIAGVWAALKPAMFAVIFAFVLDGSAVIDVTAVGSCIIIVWSAFRPTPRALLAGSILVLLLSSFAGFIHHFRDTGESGPLPYEWLNGYFQFTFPLLALVAVKLFRIRLLPGKEDVR